MDGFDRRWYADPRLHGDDYFIVFPLAILEQTASQVEGLVHLLDLPPGARMLDLACGWGRIALPLAQRGYRVTGLDLSEAFVDRARRDAQAAGLDIDFRRGDMREIPFAGKFDAVIMMWSAFGVLESDEEDQEVLHAVARALRPGGRFLIEQASREHVVRHFQARDWHQREGGTLVLHERELDLLESRNYVRMTVIEPDGSRRNYDHTFRFYTLTEFVDMLDRAELAFRAVWGGFDGSPYTLYSRRMIVLAQKEA
jgi:cyclopropane fatty-acyl-phospholipid synthase-like methyltransferase